MKGLRLRMSLFCQRLRPPRWRGMLCCTTFLTLLPALMSCDMAQNKIQASRSGSEVTSISKITPIAAKPNEVVSLTGSNFYPKKNLKVSLDLANGERASVPLVITDTKTASFTMPEGAGLGVKDLTLTQGTAQMEVAKFNLVADQADNQLPIWVGEASEICNTREYIDRNGDKQTGTKDCSSGVTPPVCTQNGAVGCVTTEFYKAADLTNLSAGNVKSGVTIAGVLGSVTPSPAVCSANGQQSCVATGSYFAGTACAADGSNCFLPAYSVLGSQTKKAIDFATIDSSKMLNTLTVSGVTGTIAPKGSWNLTLGFPGPGYYTGTSAAPAASTYTGALFGTAGTAVLKPSDCSADGVEGCVTTAGFRSAAVAGAASKIIEGQTLAGVSGNVLLPSEGDVRLDVTFGVNNVMTGTLDPGAGVPASCGSDNQTNCVANSNYPSVDKSRIVTNTGKILSDFSVAGIPGAVSTCAADGSGCFLPAYSVMTQPLKAIDFDLITMNATSIRSGTTLGGVPGALADCSADGGVGCVVVGPSFAAAEKAGAASKILQGQVVGGVSGNVTLPAESKVLTGTQYGISGTGSTGALTLPLATNVLSGSGTYGEPGALMTPALADRGTWNLTTAFPGSGYYSGTSNTPATGTYTGTLFGTAGTAVLRPADCSANNAIGCVTTSTYKSADLTNLLAGNIKSSVTIAGVTGNYPSATSPLAGSDTTADLSNDLTTRESQLRSATDFEFFMSDGTRVQAQGDSDIVAGNIASGFNIFGQAGGATLSPVNCSSNGQQSCVATGSYFAGTNCTANGSGCYLPTYALTTQPLKAVNYDTINTNAGNIRTSATLGGVTGTLADCATNAATGCVTTATYQSADLADLHPGNIKSGVTIAGTVGQYPNGSFPLAGSNGTDLTSATFNAQIKSSATYQYFGSDGARYTGSGDTDIMNTNIASGVDIFGTNGTLSGAVAPDPWNVRVGVTINGVAGKLKVSCRNRANLSIYDIGLSLSATANSSTSQFSVSNHGLSDGTAVRLNYNTAPSGLDNITTYYAKVIDTNTITLYAESSLTTLKTFTTNGTTLTVHKWQATPQVADVWETLEDYNNGIAGQLLPPDVVPGWGNDTDCGGVEAIAGDSNIWKDVTTTTAGAASNCSTDAARCTMQDKITGLWWSKVSTNALATWYGAMESCRTLSYNGQTGWRLPTLKELMEAHVHGIRSAASANFIPESSMNNSVYLWTATSRSWDPTRVKSIYLGVGDVGTVPKSNPGLPRVCVR